MTTATKTKSIRCGNCKGTHGHSSEVKACYDGAPAQSTLRTAGTTPVASLATPKQLAFIQTLMAERVVGTLHANDVQTKDEASALIKALLACDKKAMDAPKPQSGYPVVAPGYYAIASATGNNDLDFFVVQAGKGKWEGRSFVKRVVGGHPEFSIQGPHARIVLERIQDAPGGPEAAAAKYGQEIGQCGMCNRTLTDEESRALGIGPVCRQKGW